MNYAEAIQALKDSGLENAADIVATITKEATELQKYKKQHNELETLINSALQGFGSESDSYEQRLKSLSTELQTTKQSLETEKKSKEEFEGKVRHLERYNLVQTAASKSGASVEVLDKLLAGSQDELKVEGDTVTIAGKPLKDYAEANWKPFIPALLPQSAPSSTTDKSNTPPSTSLPSGSPQGKQESVDPLAGVLGGYKLPEKFSQGS
ncbi:hypothetical protein [Anabaena lutea]|uniref:Uncharacterized protein n=1 Tax=Anabaena lutea FACHB-196 TaxID=2692881 RepID=A0ABR8FJU5_9NOST|nr:hypothetical protein [Anabaena lutea]MBD2570044.1 hypothetical protein [Anabaena lutea FACHB-196]